MRRSSSSAHSFQARKVVSFHGQVTEAQSDRGTLRSFSVAPVNFSSVSCQDTLWMVWGGRCVFWGVRPFLSLRHLRPEKVRLYSSRPANAGRVVGRLWGSWR